MYSKIRSIFAGRISAIRGESEASLQTIGADLKRLEKVNEALKERILQLELERQELEQKKLESLRDQMSQEKCSSQAERHIKEIKVEIAGQPVENTFYPWPWSLASGRRLIVLLP